MEETLTVANRVSGVTIFFNFAADLQGFQPNKGVYRERKYLVSAGCEDETVWVVLQVRTGRTAVEH